MTVYANLVNNEIRGTYDLLPVSWNGHSDFRTMCAGNDEFMKQNGFVRIVRDKTPFNSETHLMSDFPWYTVENGEVIEHRDILELPPQPVEENPTETPNV